ncbi:hypothetical protein AAFN90_03285 [Erwiniaceae bacterium CAU 1747]
MTIVACLHAARSNIDVFEQALRELDYPDVELLHRVETELFDSAVAQNEVTPEIIAATRQAISELCELADVVIVTCTTLGTAAWETRFSKPVLRIDATLAKVASRYHGTILVLCTAHSTLESTSRLFSAFIPGERLVVELIPRAWAWFNQGDIAGYHQAIADYVRQRPECALGCIVLAQASMSGAEKLIHTTLSVLCGPEVSLQAAIDSLA